MDSPFCSVCCSGRFHTPTRAPSLSQLPAHAVTMRAARAPPASEDDAAEAWAEPGKTPSLYEFTSESFLFARLSFWPLNEVDDFSEWTMH